MSAVSATPTTAATAGWDKPHGTPDLRYSATPAPIIARTSVLAAAACQQQE